jgi:competence protein ComEA
LVTGELININTATDAELESLPGIGPSLAQNIIEWRDTHGPFLEPEDIIQVSGIGQSKLEQIIDLITVR